MSIILMSVVTLTDGVGLDNVDELDECNGFDAQDDADEVFFDVMSTFSLLVLLRTPKPVTTLGIWLTFTCVCLTIWLLVVLVLESDILLDLSRRDNERVDRSGSKPSTWI